MKAPGIICAILSLSLGVAVAQQALSPDAAFKAKDANADGRLSKLEYRHRVAGCEAFEDFSPYAFERRDKDKDGYLSPGEFKAAK